MCTPRYGITLDRFMRVAHPSPRQSGDVAVDNYRFVNALLWMCRMVERVFNRMKHHRKAATRHDELDKALPANLQPILIAIHLKNTTKNPIRVNTP